MTKTFWVGLEHATDFPNGMGEDYREYVTVAEGEDEADKIHEAVVRLAKELTNIGDGCRIAIHKC